MLRPAGVATSGCPVGLGGLLGREKAGRHAGFSRGGDIGLPCGRGSPGLAARGLASILGSAGAATWGCPMGMGPSLAVGSLASLLCSAVVATSGSSVGMGALAAREEAGQLVGLREAALWARELWLAARRLASLLGTARVATWGCLVGMDVMGSPWRPTLPGLPGGALAQQVRRAKVSLPLPGTR